MDISTHKRVILQGKYMGNRKLLAKLICEATQKTGDKCDETCRALCDCEGYCSHCMIISDHLISNGVTIKRHEDIDFDYEAEDL